MAALDANGCGPNLEPATSDTIQTRMSQFDHEASAVIAADPRYSIDRKGNVWDNRKSRQRVLQTNENGYRCLQLSRRHHKVHFLVASAFILRSDGCTDVDHINRDRTDNRVENLRWCTRSMNMGNSLGWTTKRKHELPKNVRKNKWGRYYVRLTKDGIERSFGGYATVEEAVAAAGRARRELFGEFARDV